MRGSSNTEGENQERPLVGGVLGVCQGVSVPPTQKPPAGLLKRPLLKEGKEIEVHEILHLSLINRRMFFSERKENLGVSKGSSLFWGWVLGGLFWFGYWGGGGLGVLS